MQRRQFIKTMAALGSASPIFSFAQDAVNKLPRQAEPAWALGFRSMDSATLSTPQLPMRGKLPAALRGVLYRNGPARHDRGEQRYKHWFDGDGMVNAYRFTPQGISHHAKFVLTDKFLVEEKAGRFLLPAFGTIFPNTARVADADSMNVANISMLHHSDELLALWEGGSAYRVDADTLQTLGKKTWRADLAGMPFSAHPKVEPDGTLWNFGTVGNQNLLVLYRISAQGELQKVDALPVSKLPMIHDFAITERHLVFLLPPFKIDAEQLAAGESIASSYRWQPQQGMRVLTIDKNDWSKRRIYETKSGFVFHIANAWEDAQGVIRLSYMRSDDDAVFMRGFEVMQGLNTLSNRTHISLMRIDPQSGKVSEEKMPEEAEFPSVDHRYTGRRHRQLISLACQPSKASYGFDQVQRRDLVSGLVDRYHYGADMVAEEHVLIPDLSSASPEAKGWVVGTALDLKKKITVLSVFNAMALRDGPIVQASLPYALPLGLHGVFHRTPV
jgi:all-trans-8'-apo-beta-carotenal 15,15'-oxygenase